MDNKDEISGAFWITVPEQELSSERRRKNEGIEVAYYRHSFYLQEKCALMIAVSATSRYRLWINGRHVVAGPCKGDSWSHYYETLDVSEYLNIGENIIAAKVVAYPPYEVRTGKEQGPLWSVSNAAGPCFILKGICLDNRETVIADITTGQADWRVQYDRAITGQLFDLSNWMGSMEIVDGKKLPYRWKDSSLDESQWLSAAVKWSTKKNIFGVIPVLPLKKRPIPLLYEKEKGFSREMSIKKGDLQPFSFIQSGKCISSSDTKQPILWSAAYIPPHSLQVVELDAGELTTGYFQLVIESGAGSEIKIRYAECYSLENPETNNTIKGLRDDSENYSMMGHEDIYYPSGRSEIYEPFSWRAFQFIRIEVQTAMEGITIYPPAFVETGYPLKISSNIYSSDPWIEPLWDMSVRTLRRCMHETYEDCPYYEQLQYTMDTRLQILFTYMTGDDTRMALRAINDFHSSLLPEGILQCRYPTSERQVIPAFSLHWIFLLEDYYWQTGDTQVIKRYRPTIDAILDWFDRKVGAFGLVEQLGYWEYADWVEEWSDLQGVPPAALEGPSTIHNLIYAYGLQAASRLLKDTGRETVSEEYHERAVKIIENVEKFCWSDKEGLYMEGPNFETFSQHAQVWAVLCGAAKGDKAKSVMKGALNRDNIAKCSFPLQFYMFRALEKAGLYDETRELWNQWKELLSLHLTTIPETPFRPRSDCHGWGALPLYEFTCKFLGVNPLVPGWKKILIEPKCFYAKSLKGEVITPKGIVQVEIENENGELRIFGRGPEGVELVLKLPGNIEQVYTKGGIFHN